MKCIWLIVLTMVGMVCAFANEPCQWDQHLGNPGRTAYTDCSIPDSPEVLWEITLDGVAGTPFIVGDKVIVFSQFYSFFPPPLEAAPPSNVTVIDLLTGTLLRKIVPEEDFVGVYPVGDTVLINTGVKLYKLDLASEEISFVSTVPRTCFCLSGCHPLILPDKIVFPTTPAVCLSRDGYSMLWDLETSLGSLYPDTAEVLSIAASMDRVYVVLEEKNDRRVLAVDAETGKLIWMKDIVVTGIAADGPTVFAAGEDLYALDAGTGEILWTFELEFTWSNIAIGPAAVYSTDIQHYLYAVDKNTGELKWKSQWEEAEWITYIVGAGNSIICSNILNLTAFSAKDGKELWNIHFRDYSGPFPDKPCPAVSEGIVVIPKKELQQGDSFVMIRPEQLVALASDPYLFVKQGDAFLSEGLKDQAISSYEKAAELYEKKGDTSQSQEIREYILELKNQPESPPPETTPSATTLTPPETTQPESPPPTTPSKPSNPLIPLSAVVIVVLIGILITYYLIKHKKSRND